MSISTVLTIPQAAKRLGLTERRLRALLNQPEYVSRTRRVTIRTRHGARAAVRGVPPDLYGDLERAVDMIGAPPPAREIVLQAETAPASPLPQLLLDEKDARIADLRQENEYLRQENKKLHMTVQLAQYLVRQQALRYHYADAEPVEVYPPANPPPVRGLWGVIRRIFSDTPY